MWLYGSGFPKSMALDKALEGKLTMGNANKTQFHKLNGKQEEKHHYGFTAKNKEMGVRPKDYTTEGQSKSYLKELEATTELAQKYKGWGTCLKPAFEPVIVARKPFKGNLVDNVIEYGVGGINIDECRVETNGELIDNHITAGTPFMRNKDEYKQLDRSKLSQGRFPSNTILTYGETDEEDVCGGFPDTKSTPRIPTIGGTGGVGQATNFQRGSETSDFNDSGSASRYFYCAKASKKDRDEGLKEFEEKQVRVLNATNPELENKDDVSKRFITIKKNIHPTVKPTELMQYLVRLVTPKGGTVLDPFNGSGSTGKAVAFENRERGADYKYIGIELDKNYCDISKARIQWASDEYVYLDDEQVSKEQIDKVKKVNNKNKGIRLW